MLLTEGVLIGFGTLRNAKSTSEIVEKIVGTVAFGGIGGSLLGWFGKFMGEMADKVAAARGTASDFITTLSAEAKKDLVTGLGEALTLAFMNTGIMVHKIAAALVENPLGLTITTGVAVVAGLIMTGLRILREQEVKIAKKLDSLAKEIAQAVGSVTSKLEIVEVAREERAAAEVRTDTRDETSGPINLDF